MCPSGTTGVPGGPQPAPSSSTPPTPAPEVLDHYFRANEADHSVFHLHLVGQSIVAAALAVLSSAVDSPVRAVIVSVLSAFAMVANSVSHCAVLRAEAFRKFWEGYDKDFFCQMRKVISTRARKIPGRDWLFRFFYLLYLGIALYAWSNQVEIRIHSGRVEVTSHTDVGAETYPPTISNSAQIIVSGNSCVPDSCVSIRRCGRKHP